MSEDPVQYGGEEMKVREITDRLEKAYPPQLAMDWDNPGLQVGRMDREVRRIAVALDATDEVIALCIRKGVQLLVTHHPLFMSGVKKINDEDYHGRKVLAMAEYGIAHYAMHTNYDVAKMAELAKDALKLADAQVLEVTGRLEDGTACGIGSVGRLPHPMSARECCAYVKEAFGLDNVRLFGSQEAAVEKLAVSPGSGKSMITPALLSGAQVLVTGDIGHHDGLDAVDQGLLVIDAGHYGIEHIFIRQASEYLRECFPGIEVEAVEAGSPFIVL